MRYQQLIYIQNQHQGVRNKDILNVNTSSDICVFNSPLYTVSGASKIDCTGTTGTTYVISTGTTIPVTFNFTANTDSFNTYNTTFNYEVYKYNTDLNIFVVPPVYKSETFEFSAFSATSAITESIPVSDLSLDGEYLIKGYYSFDSCTEFMSQFSVKIDTSYYKYGTEYGLYQPSTDFYFIAIKEAEKPIFSLGVETQPVGSLFQQVILPPAGITNFVITNDYLGEFVLTLNGLTLAYDYDYTYSGSLITLNAPTTEEDIITVIYTKSDATNISADNIDVTSISSGTTNNQGSNKVYYNTTTNKFEIYTNNTPKEGSDIIVMINGATLANGVDYYQSTSNLNRIILEGDLIIGDMVTIVYFPEATVINGLQTNYPMVVWNVQTPPKTTLGEFNLEVSTTSTFNTFYYSGSTPYVLNQTVYHDSFTASGTVGTVLYYRVKNHKKLETLCGYIVDSIVYSETVPLTIQTNSINSY